MKVWDVEIILPIFEAICNLRAIDYHVTHIVLFTFYVYVYVYIYILCVCGHSILYKLSQVKTLRIMKS